MSDTDSLRAQYAAAIRPNMLLGLQDAELDGPGGTQRINEWVDWIADAVLAVRDREMAQLRTDLAGNDEEIARLTAHTDATCGAVAERDRLAGELEELRAGLTALAPYAEPVHGDRGIGYQMGWDAAVAIAAAALMPSGRISPDGRPTTARARTRGAS